MIKSAIAVIALTLGLSVSQATAAPKDSGTPKKKASPEKVFKKRDKDHDSLLSKEEFVRGAKAADKRERIFGKKDKNGDDKLTLSEFKGTKKTAKKGKKGKKADKKTKKAARKKGKKNG